MVIPPVSPSKLDCLKLANALRIKFHAALLLIVVNDFFKRAKLLHSVAARLALSLGGEGGGLFGREERQGAAVVHCPNHFHFKLRHYNSVFM